MKFAISITVIFSFLTALYFSSVLFAKKESFHPEEKDQSKARHRITASICFAVFFPLFIFLHECGHYQAGRLAGFELIFLHDKILLPPQPRPENFEAKMFWFTLCGPLVELSIATIGLIFLWRFRKKITADSAPILYWISTLFTCAGFRWLRIDLDSTSDERALSVQLDLPPWTIAAAMLPLSLYAAWLVIDVHRRNRTIRPLVIAFFSGLVSVLLYLFVWGRWITRTFSEIDI